ncbi:MAG: FAD:protein FMN transferase [Lachnospiraceae bacterium]|nr:FAD:protein FMN transferase [Lachnospiraceae bacterium]
MASTITKFFRAFGTICQISVSSDMDPAITEDVKNAVMNLDKKLSPITEESETARLGAKAGYSCVHVSRDTYKLFELCKKAAEETNGIFNIANGPAAHLWEQVIEGCSMPSDLALFQAKHLINADDIILETRDNDYLVGLKHEGQSVNLRGVIRGYCMDMAADLLIERGCREALLNFDGLYRSIGTTKTVGIRDAFSPVDVPMGTVDLEDGMSAVSCCIYNQYRETKGRLFHPIINGRTGLPADTDLAAVTLIGKNATELDICAYTAICLGMEESLSLLKAHKQNAIFVTRDGLLYSTFDFSPLYTYVTQLQM